jgi:hypothetical protein
MLVNIIIYLVAPPAAEAVGGIQPLVTLSAGSGLVLQLILDSVVVGILWGVVYAIDDGRSAARWKDWQRGLVFASLPFMLVMLVQLLIILQSGRAARVWLIVGLGEVVRWGTYGVLIGLTYPVLRARRLQALPDALSVEHSSMVADLGD